MKEIISKELLSEILKTPADLIPRPISFINVNRNTIVYGMELSWKDEINLYELMHKAKEWLVSKRKFPKIDYHPNGWIECSINYDIISERAEALEGGYTEPEAVFKACMRILENKSLGE